MAMKIIGYLFFLLLIIECASKKIETIKDCRGLPTNLNKALKKPEKVKYVAIFDYQDIVFPSEELLKLSNLKCLRIYGPNKISQSKKFDGIPSKLNIDITRINQLNKLAYLDLAWLDLSQFPTDLFQLKNIKFLTIDCGFIDSIPVGITNLQNLEILSFRLNKISQLPPWLNQLKKLKALDMSNNAFDHIPTVLFELKNLQVVSLSNPEKYDPKLEPFEFSTNKIDYLKNIESLVKLLYLGNMKKVYIEVQNYNTKKKIIDILKEKDLDKKIGINIVL
ncbi:MAG: hypothetical protein HYY40_10740 [Bacteroidetes bacterium]|nr:hypothetical protein [Bacteroidota bacterium]